MKSFQDYFKIRETSATELGYDVLGRSSLDAETQKAYTLALQALNLIMRDNPMQMISFLQRMAEANSSVRDLLAQNGITNFNDSEFKAALRNAAKKSGKNIDRSIQSDADVVAPPGADSFSGQM